MPRRRPVPLRAFTLIELLVVISIISLLVALLLPALAKARAAVIVTKCLAQQRMLGVGWAAYTNEFKQIPGINYNEGTYGGGPWGRPYFYGGVNLYLSDAAFGQGWIGLMNMGYTVPYVLDGASFGNMSNMKDLDGRVYYCPGTKVSWETHTYGRAPWFSFWRTYMGQPLTPNSGESVPSTYFYRGGHYETRRLAAGDPAWGTNWNTSVITRPDDAAAQGKPMLTCFWRGYNSNAPADGPIQENLPHGLERTNVLRTDGSAFTWGLPDGVKPLWAWFDAGAYTSGAYNGDDFYAQLPWFWTMADRRAR